MQRLFAFCLLLAVPATANASSTNPIAKVLQMLGDLQTKIKQEGIAEDEVYTKFNDWCVDTERSTKFDIEDATTRSEKLSAQLTKLASDSSEAKKNIDNLASEIAQMTQKQEDARAIRAAEKSDFVKAEAELEDTISTLERAIGVLNRKAAHNSAFLQQVDAKNSKAVVVAVNALIESAVFSHADGHKLSSLIQSEARNKETDDDMEMGAPEAAAYTSKSGNIIEILEDLLDKAEKALETLRGDESTNSHNFQMLDQSLTDEVAASEKDKVDNAEARDAAQEETATARKDLGETQEDLRTLQKDLKVQTTDCTNRADAHAESVKGRGEELAALAKAEEVLRETTGGAGGRAYNLVQVKTHADLVNLEVIAGVKQLAKEQQSTALAQLASRMTAVTRMAEASGEDPFAKVKGLIGEMLNKLQTQQAEEANQKAYCDKHQKKNNEAKAELIADVDRLTSKISRATSAKSTLENEVKDLEAELSELASKVKERTEIRGEENTEFIAAQAELKLGIAGVTKATEVLREYYASALIQRAPETPGVHDKKSADGQGIIDILEICLSDFTRELAKAEHAETEAQTNFDAFSQEAKTVTAMKETAVKNKSSKITHLSKDLSQWEADLKSENNELDAVMDVAKSLKDQCTHKAVTYEQRAARRSAEIDGLKGALKTLEEAAFMQKGSRNLRSVASH